MDQSGKADYYTIVIGHRLLLPSQFIPQILDERDGVLRKDPNTGKPKKIYIEPRELQNVKDKLIAGWATKKPNLDSLPRHFRTLINAVKAFMATRPSALWWHNENNDHCSEFGGPHFHLVVSASLFDGQKVRPHCHSKYRDIVAAVKLINNQVSESRESNNCYIRQQVVKREVSRIIAHLHVSPRKFMGCNDRVLAKICKRTKPNVELGDFDDLVESGSESSEDEKTPALDDYDTICGVQPATYNNIVEKDHQIVRKKRSANDVSDSSDDEDLPPPSKKMAQVIKDADTIKETKADRLYLIVKNLVELCQQYNWQDICRFYMSAECKESKEWAPASYAWARMMAKASTKTITARAAEELQNELASASFETILEKFKSRPFMPGDKPVMTLLESLDWFFEWLTFQGLDAGDFCCSIFNVIDRRLPKKNAVLLIGPSNAGKTAIVQKSLKGLFPVYGEVKNLSATSTFVWEELLAKRVGFIDEGACAPSNVETFKRVLEGDKVTIDSKHQKDVMLTPPPLIISSNYELYRYSPADRDAINNRIERYEVKKMEKLAEMTHQMNPGIWAVLYKIYQAESFTDDDGNFNSDSVVITYEKAVAAVYDETRISPPDFSADVD